MEAVASARLVAYILGSLESVDTGLEVALADSLVDGSHEADIGLVHLADHHKLVRGLAAAGMVVVLAIGSPTVPD